MSRLLSYRGEGVEEFLANHLAETAYHAYVLASKRETIVRLAALLAGLLHDIGKALDIYQDCVLKTEKRCSYLAHEVFSTIMSAEILENLSKEVPLEAKCYALHAILFHHQALGNPLERIGELVERLAKQKTGASFSEKRAKQLAAELLETVKLLEQRQAIPRDILEAVKTAIQTTDWNKITTRINTLLETRIAAIARLAPQQIEEARKPFKKLLGEPKTILYSKLVTGILIMADIHAASKKRAKQKQPLHNHLEKLIKFLTTNPQPNHSPNPQPTP